MQEVELRPLVQRDASAADVGNTAQRSNHEGGSGMVPKKTLQQLGRKRRRLG